MPKYTVKIGFQGYVRGTSTVQVIAESEEEALEDAHSIDLGEIDFIRNDSEITDKEIINIEYPKTPKK